MLLPLTGAPVFAGRPRPPRAARHAPCCPRPLPWPAIATRPARATRPRRRTITWLWACVGGRLRFDFCLFSVCVCELVAWNVHWHGLCRGGCWGGCWGASASRQAKDVVAATHRLEQRLVLSHLCAAVFRSLCVGCDGNACRRAGGEVRDSKACECKWAMDEWMNGRLNG